jgi:hypothetical protein
MKRIYMSLAVLVFSGAFAAHADPDASVMVIDHIDQFINPVLRAADDPKACDLDAAKSICTNKSMTYTFKGCSIDNGKFTLSGSWDETYDGVGAEACTSPLMNGETQTRTSSGLTFTAVTGESLFFDTLGGTAYDGTVISNKGVSVSQDKDVKSISADGVHMLYKDKAGNVQKEGYAMSTAPALVSGSKDDGSFLVQSGSVRVFDQLDKATADISVNQVAWSDKACCHPVSGTIQQVWSGSKTGARTLTFTSTCGTVNVVDQDGNASTVTLPACQ